MLTFFVWRVTIPRHSVLRRDKMKYAIQEIAPGLRRSLVVLMNNMTVDVGISDSEFPETGVRKLIILLPHI